MHSIGTFGPVRSPAVPTILLTNDDGVDSPALVPFARALARVADVRVCVPDQERSWVGKAITRHGEIRVALEERGGVEITTCTGYPADAAQLGIHHLFDPAPDLVVSGINLGLNHGAAFLLSSGTVGAAIEGWISGVPAIAFSTGGTREGSYHAWREYAESPAAVDEWRDLAALCAALVGDLDRAGLHEHADVISVNLPWDAGVDTPRRVTSIARVGYEQLFRATGVDTYAHQFGDVRILEDLEGTDIGAAGDGAISITPVRVPHAEVVPDDVRAAIERP